MRSLVAFLLAVAFVVLVPLADLGAWAQRELVDTTSFVSLGQQVLEQQAVRDALADRVVGDLEARAPALVGHDASLRPLVAEALSLPPVRSALGAELASTHDQLRQGHDPLELDLAPLLPILRQQLPSNLAADLPAEALLTPVTVLRRSEAPVLWEGVQLVQDSALALPVAALVVLVLAVAVSRRRGILCIVLGALTAAIGVGLIAVVRPGRSVLERQTGSATERAAFVAGYTVVTKSFVEQTVGVVAAGLLLVVVGGVWAWSEGRDVRPRSWA